MWAQVLNGYGYSEGINDMRFEWFGDLGYTGQVNERWMQFLLAGGAPSPTASDDRTEAKKLITKLGIFTMLGIALDVLTEGIRSWFRSQLTEPWGYVPV